MCLFREGGAVVWLMLVTIIIPIVFIPLSIVIGIIKDIDCIRRNKEIHGDGKNLVVMLINFKEGTHIFNTRFK
ncbi:hypothetical protein D3C75_978990 [compost metagenome]